jgi:hypothetical protein
MMWMREVMNEFNSVEVWHTRTRGTFFLVASWRVQYTRVLGK